MRAGVSHLGQIPPWQRNPIAAVDRTQKPGRIGIEEVPVRVGRNLRHPPHDDSGRQLESLARFDPVLLPREEPAKRNLRAQQSPREKAALEITPRMQHILRVHAAIADAALRAAAHFAARCMLGLQPIATMQNAMREVRSEVELQTRRIGLQRPVEINRARRLEERPQHTAYFPIIVTGQKRLAIEPSQASIRAACRASSDRRRPSGKRRSPTLSAARSRSGKSLRDIS